MSGFDIDSLLKYSPPRYMCEKCCALNLPDPDYGSDEEIVCPVCKVRYVSTGDVGPWDFKHYFENRGGTIKFKDPLEHAKQLARIVSSYRNSSPFPALRLLLSALDIAEQFVHFTSFGMTHLVVGALKVVAQKVHVRGIVSSPGDSSSELSEFPNEAPNLNVHCFSTDSRLRDVPHQKLIVIDGLLAFKGSVNLTQAGWRKVDKGLDMLDIVTDISEVIRLHNEFFSPVWGSVSDQGESIDLQDTDDSMPDELYL